MAQYLGVFDQWFRGEWADRTTINQNAQELDIVETNLSGLRTQVQQQAQEILRLRAMLMGVVEVLHAKAPFDDAELQRAVQTAWYTLTAPPPAAMMGGDPYRGTPAPPVPVHMTTCIQCKRQVPSTQTNITARGEVCDACS